jgi:outer membrane protein assembly factor BamB
MKLFMKHFNYIFAMSKYLIILTLFFTSLANAQVIGQWRGLDRSGIYPETGLLKIWPENGPELLWMIKDLPKGNSSVVVVGDTYYLTGNADSVDVLVAIDNNKKIKWKTRYGKSYESYPESRSTPTIEGDRIYVSSGTGNVACISALNGKILWNVDSKEKFGCAPGKWGVAESLLLFKDMVFYTTGGNKTTMVALNKITGELVWTSDTIGDKRGYVSPVLIQRGGKNLIVTVTERHIVALDANNGKILWKFDYSSYSDPPGKRTINITAPLFSEGKVFVTSGYNHKAVMLNLSEDASKVTLEWTDSILDNHHGGVVLINGFIYGSNWIDNGRGNWCCIDWKTGKKMYENKWITKGSIISADGMLYCYEEKTGNLALVKPNQEKFELVSSFKITNGTGVHWAHPVINKGILYVRHGECLMAYNIKDKSASGTK